MILITFIMSLWLSDKGVPFSKIIDGSFELSTQPTKLMTNQDPTVGSLQDWFPYFHINQTHCVARICLGTILDGELFSSGRLTKLI